MNRASLIAKREYLKVVTKPMFWLSVLLPPLLFTIIGGISGYSAKIAEDKIKEEATNVQAVYIRDEANIIKKDMVREPFFLIDNVGNKKQEVIDEKADALIIIPADIQKGSQIQVFQQDKGIFSNGRFVDVVQGLVKSSILSEVPDKNKISLYHAQLPFTISTYKEGKETNTSLERFIVPGISVIVFFLLTTIGASFMLMSASEEKENRAIETILSLVKPRELILGKLIGLMGIVFTQFGVLTLLSSVVFIVGATQMPIDFSKIVVDPVQVILAIFYTFTGFVIIANTMMAVGAATPNYKDAQNMSTTFIILSILPVYFFTLILSDPNGLIARILSYFPFASSLVLVMRNALGALPVWEIVLSIIVNIVYMYLSFVIAFKMFEIGALELNKKISLANLFKK